MSRMIHCKYGYETREWIQADARLDKWIKDKKRLANQQDALEVHKSINESHDLGYPFFDHQ